ncbi:unnamed protein product [Phytophthora fragariaefolia]|uniref:Unnamed protein product n=1 Tax=Phytophthora fragariaefolia TaxID=1490495 RepID=A0A9W6Y330_9STRA|nr:unnamed protein product [Phytophthora fragariaefolia]
MYARTPAVVAAVASIIAAGLAAANVDISVQYDATYSLPESRGFPCSGDGKVPAGVACPQAADFAVADCYDYLLSFNEGDCVAPVDAECVLVNEDTWGCAFPQTGHTTGENETTTAYSEASSGWGSSYDEGVQVGQDDAGYDQVGYDTTANTPLTINCEVGKDEATPATNTEDYSPTPAPTESTEGGDYGTTETTESGSTTEDYTSGSESTEGGDYGTPETTESGSTTEDYTTGSETSDYYSTSSSYETGLIIPSTEGSETTSTYGSASTGSAAYTSESASSEGGEAYPDYGTSSTGSATYTTGTQEDTTDYSTGSDVYTSETTSTGGSQATEYYGSGSATYTSESNSNEGSQSTVDYGTSSTGSATYTAGSTTEGGKATVNYGTSSTGSATYTSTSNSTEGSTSSSGSAIYTTSASGAEQTVVEDSTGSSGSKTTIDCSNSTSTSTSTSGSTSTSTSSSASASNSGSDASTTSDDCSKSTEGSKSDEDCGSSSSGKDETTPATNDGYTKEGKKIPGDYKTPPKEEDYTAVPPMDPIYKSTGAPEALKGYPPQESTTAPPSKYSKIPGTTV